MRPSHVLGAVLFSLQHILISAQIQLYQFTTEETGLPSGCVTILNLAVTCSDDLEWAGRGRYEADDILQNLCTTACTSSLSDWLRRAKGACTTRFLDGQGNAILPAYWVEAVVENYNLLCQKNGDKFCNAVIRDAAGIDPENQSQTKSAISTVTCDDCFLKQMQTRLQMPLQSNTDMARTFTSLTSACKKSSFPVTPISPSTAWITPVASGTTSGVPLPVPTSCDGANYTLRSGDTCQSIALARGISVAGLLTANNLQAFCANFPTSGTLCIPATERCRTYAVKANETCAKIADTNDLTWTQIVSWNPVFGTDCRNIRDYVGYPICISTPGGNWVNPSPEPIATTTTASLSTLTGIEATLLPRPTNIGSINGSDIWSYKYAEGTRLDCVKYVNGSDFGQSASCADIAKAAGVNATDLSEWNPSLKESCILDGELTYCAQRLRQNGTATMTEFCNLQDVAAFNMTCDAFMAVWGINSQRLNDFNPGVGIECENWVPGRSYCVMARHYRQPGIVSICNKFVMANETNWLADPCGQIEAANGLVHARFVAWNPSVYSNCTGIGYQYGYCVSIPGYIPTYTSYVFPSPTAATIKALGIRTTQPETSVGNSISPSLSSSVDVSTTTEGVTSSATTAPHLHFHGHKRFHNHV